MPQVDRLEASEVAGLVERALAAPAFEAALPLWRAVFVERLDFRAATGALRWSLRRRRHQARAMPCHYSRRQRRALSSPLPP